MARYPKQHLEKTQLPMAVLAIDNTGQLPITSKGNRWALTAICLHMSNMSTIAEPLKFFNLLCDLEQNLCIVFNKLNNIEYTCGVVNLSNYPLTNMERNVLSKGLGFCPTPGAPDIGNLIQDLDEFKRKTRLQLFFSGNNENPSEDSNQSDAPFEHKSFKNKSTFNPIGPFQLESVFYSIEQDLHRQR